MDNSGTPEERLNLDGWEQIQSPSPNQRTTSREWDTAAIRDNFLRDSLSFFAPRQHEGFPTTTATTATTQDHHDYEEPISPASPVSSSSSSSSNGLAIDDSSSSDLTMRPCFDNLSSGIARIVAAKVRRCAVYIRNSCSIASVTGAVSAVLLCLVYAKVRRWRRRFQEENNHLNFLIKQKDQKISQLLLQIAQMNELLLTRRKIPVLRIG